MNNHLRLWYKFEATNDRKVIDLSGNNFDGIYENHPIWSTGMSGDSFKMEGNNGPYITIPKGVLKEMSSITIATRVKWLNSSVVNQWIYALGVDGKKCIYATPK